MRQIIASAVIAATVFAAASPTFAQRAPRSRPAVQQTASDEAQTNSIADFQSIQAVTSGVGVAVQWTMTRENRVAVYQVYRTDAKGRVPVGSPVIGSAGKTRQDFMYGESYSTYDADGTPSSVYDIEAIGTAMGAKAGSQQISPTFDRGASLMAASAAETSAAAATNSTFQSTSPATPQAQLAPPDPTTQLWVAGHHGAKIGVKVEGLCRVTRAELTSAKFFNIPGSDNSANWRLFESGNEVPIIVGANDQYIEFYARGLDTPESDTRMYYLLVDSTPGARIETHTVHSAAGTPVNGTFRSIAQMKERLNYIDTIFNGDTENFWGAIIFSPTPVNEKITLSGVDPNGPDAILTVTVQGWFDGAHDIVVTVNGSALPIHVTGQGQQRMISSFNIPAALLVNGQNTVGFRTTASSGDGSLFDNMKVSFTQFYQASENAVKMFTGGRRKVVLNGFSSPSVSSVTITSGTQTFGAATTATSTVASTTPGVIRLSSPAYTGVAGGSSVARVTVARVYGSTGSAGVTLSLANGTAVGGASCGSGADYVNGGPIAVTFGTGEVTKDIDVPLCAGAAAGKTFTVSLSNATGATLANSNIRVFDITSDAPQTIAGLPTTQSGNNNGMILPAYRAATLFATDDAYAKQAASVTYNAPSSLTSSSNAADMLIISYSDPTVINGGAETWAGYRRSPPGGGFNVKVVDVADIYDEFNYGVRSANSLNSFLKFAYQNWQTKPKYVLLIGDASFDPKNYAGFGDWDLVPTKMVQLIFQESGSDEALADFNGDGLAEIPIGRIPARDAATVTQLYHKMQAQEQESVSGQPFSRGAVFVNGAPRGYDFASMNQTLSNELSSVPTRTFVNETDPNPTTSTVNAVNTGPYIVNYAGHGASGLWGDSGFFKTQTVSQLTNTNKQSIFTMLTCLNGYFLNNTTGDCLAEVLLKSTAGGASLTWASTTETTPDVQLTMGQRFYHQLNAGTYKRVGDLISDAKAQIQGGSDVRYSWALLGDPATQIRP
jgi:hypothetical protein